LFELCGNGGSQRHDNPGERAKKSQSLRTRSIGT
jgi:hypothetical protein